VPVLLFLLFLVGACPIVSLVAKGLAPIDYDRLSVAYGLSQIKLDKVVFDVPPLDEPNRTDYTDRYTDKSAV
jgi:hypothetical protein